MDKDQLPVGPLDERGGRLPVAGTGARGLETRHPGLLSVEMQSEQQADADAIDLLAYWRILVKRRWLVLGVLATVLTLALVRTLMTTPIYRATAILKLDNNDQQVLQVGETNTGGAWGGWDPDFLRTQYELLRSRSLAERVADELALDDAAMNRLTPPSWLSRVVGLVRPEAKPKANERVGDADRMKRDAARATGIISGGLVVEPVQESKLVRVNFDSPDPQFAARAANGIADGFIASEIERRFGASSYAKTYIEQQLKLVKSRLEDSERQLVDFAQKENLVNTADGQSLANQNLSDLNSALATAQEQRIRAQARWQQAQGALTSDMLANSMVRTLQQQKAELQQQYQQKLAVYKPDYPDMLQLKGQMDALDKQIGAETGNVRRSVQAEYAAAMRQEALLKGQLAALRGQSLDVDSRSIQYNIIKREVDTNRQLYDGLLQRYKEVGVAGNIRPNNISIIDRAEVPGGPYKPNLMRNLALGLLVGLLLGILAAFVIEFLDDTLKTPEDIEQRLHLPVLGVIPKLGARITPEAALADGKSAFSEAYRSVRTALQFSSDHGIPKVLLVTSATPSEGKSTSATTLARKFTQLGRRTLLIEADLRKPSLHRQFAREGGVGLSNLLSGSATLEDAIAKTGDPLLDVIYAGPLPPNPAELLSGSRLVTLLDMAGRHYDQILIDGPPVIGIADAPILANIADATLFVVHSGGVKIATGQAALKRLLAARGHVVGALLARYDAKAAGYGYQYDSYYAYGNPQLTRD